MPTASLKRGSGWPSKHTLRYAVAGTHASLARRRVIGRIIEYVNREKLEARNLSPLDFTRALQRESVFVPAGNIEAGAVDYQMLANAMPA